MKELKGLVSDIREEIYSYLQDSDNESLIDDLDDASLYQLIEEKINIAKGELLLSIKERTFIRDQVFFSIRGLDVLETFLADDSISEIMVNGLDSIYLERNGRIERSSLSFSDYKRLEDAAQRIASSTDRVVNIRSPILDTRLADGSRVNIVLPPIAMDGPVITIRKFFKKPLTIEDLLSFNSLTRDAANFLKSLVIAGYNIFISGGTGSGKTTFLNVLSDFIPEDQRVITIEDSAELKLKRVKNLVRLEARMDKLGNGNEVTIRDLIKTSLRMRPDRIVVGEVRGPEALDMLQAMNTGHDGSLSTGHANSSKDMLTRLETMLLLAADMPLDAIRKQMSSAIDIMVHLSRLRDKSRRLVEISEVRGMQNGDINIEPLYLFKEEDYREGKVIGCLERTNANLFKRDKLQAAGIEPF